jgi:uncharacterized protein with ATP-grasp and redox domains
MKTTYLCARCGIDQAERALEMADVDWETKYSIMQEVLELYTRDFKGAVPAHIGTTLHRHIKNRLGFDPFDEWKKESIRVSSGIIEKLGAQIKTLKDAIKFAIIGNYIDFTTVKNEGDQEKLAKMLDEPLVIDDYGKLEEILKKSKKILYLTDNCGEHLFDLVVVKMLNRMGKEVVVAAKDEFILNDATVQDLKDAGFDKFAKVIGMGSDCIGTNLDEISKEFGKEFEEADFVIAKGMGHYETLDDVNKKIFFMLKAKCEPVARSLGVEKGSNVLKFHDSEA